MSSKQRRTLKRAVQRYSFVAWLRWIRANALRILARKLHNAVQVIVERCKVLALPAPKSKADMLRQGVDNRLGKPTLHPRPHVSFA